MDQPEPEASPFAAVSEQTSKYGRVRRSLITSEQQAWIRYLPVEMDTDIIVITRYSNLTLINRHHMSRIDGLAAVSYFSFSCYA